MKFYRKNIIAILAGVLAPVTPIVVFLAGKNGSNMIEFYCSPGSLFLGLDLSTWIYCGGTVVVTHIILVSSFFMGVFYIIARISDARLSKVAINKDKELQNKILENVSTNTKVPSIVKRFSSNLNKVVKGKTFSSPAMVFLNKTRVTPPFLGISHSEPVLPPEHERALTEYFQAVEFFKRNILLFRKDDKYQCAENDTAERIAKKIYGDEKFSGQIIEANHGGFPLSQGQVIDIPRIDPSGRILPEEIELMDMIYHDKHGALRKVLGYLTSELHLTNLEALPLMEHIYNAAQNTLNKRVS